MSAPAPQAPQKNRYSTPRVYPTFAPEILSYIRQQYETLAIVPTFEQIAEACFCSISTVHVNVQRLWREGQLQKVQGFWGNKYIPTAATPPAPVDPMIERAYRAGLQRGWEMGCNLDKNGYRRARETGFNPYLSAEEAHGHETRPKT